MKKKNIVLAAWVLYTIALVYVLFISRFGATYAITYRQWLSQCYNLIPGRALYDYFSAPYQADVVLRRVILNYIGNLMLFVPWGVLFAIGNITFKKFAIYAVIVIVTVELLQYLTMLGSFDIEDVILNVIGTIMGFLMVRQIKSKKAA